MSIKLRRLHTTDTDLAALASELNQSDSEISVKRFSAQSLKAFLADHNNFYLVAYRDGELAGAVHGYCLLHPSGIRYLYVDEVDTMAAHRRQGIATAMLKAVFQIAHDYNADEVWVGTEDDNQPAQALYRSLKPSEVEHGPIFTYKLNK